MISEVRQVKFYYFGKKGIPNLDIFVRHIYASSS